MFGPVMIWNQLFPLAYLEEFEASQTFFSGKGSTNLGD